MSFFFKNNSYPTSVLYDREYKDIIVIHLKQDKSD